MELTKTFLKMCIKRQLEYRLNFILLCIAVTPLHLLQMFFSWMVAEQFGAFGGWQKWELIFLYGLLLSTYGLTQVFFRQFRYFDNYIVQGTLDMYYVRPQSILYTIVFSNLNIMEIVSQVFPSVLILIVACIRCETTWTIGKVLFLLLTLCSGMIIQSCIFILIGILSFWTNKSGTLQQLYFSFKNFINYPIHVYGKEVVGFLTFILPLGFINYYPALYLLDKEEHYHLIDFMGFPVSVLMLLITLLLWNIAQKKYTSTGS